MAVLFDTAAVSPRERLAALHDVYDSETPPRTVVVDPRTVSHRIECVDLGMEMRLLRVRGGAMQIVRTGRQVRADPTEYLALGFHRQGLTQVSIGGLDVDVPVGHLNVVDLTQPLPAHALQQQRP